MFSNEIIVVVALVGLLGGSAVSNIGRGSGLGLPGDLVTGLLGAFIGYLILPQMHHQVGQWVISVVINAAIGASVLLLMFRVMTSKSVLGQRADRLFGRLSGTPSLKD